MMPLKKLGLNGGGSALSRLLEGRQAPRRSPRALPDDVPEFEYVEPEIPGPTEIVQQPSRLRTALLGGYNRADVDLMLAELRLTIRLLQNDVDALQERSAKLEAELVEKREFEQQHLDMSQSIAQALTHAREIEEAAREKAREIEAAAAADAQKARADAFKQIEGQEQQFASLLKLKDDLIEELRSTLTASAGATVRTRPTRKRAAPN
jgi:cell division septum initiation protein DivIVA